MKEGTIIFSLTDLFKVYNNLHAIQTSDLYCESNHYLFATKMQKGVFVLVLGDEGWCQLFGHGQFY